MLEREQMYTMFVGGKKNTSYGDITISFVLFNPVSLFNAQHTVSYTEMEEPELNERQDETLNKYIQHGKLLLSFTAHKTHKYIDRYEYIKSEKKQRRRKYDDGKIQHRIAHT